MTTTIPIRLEQHPELAPMSPELFLALNTAVACAEGVFQQHGELHPALLIFDNPNDPTAVTLVSLRGVPKFQAGQMISVVEQQFPVAMIAGG